MQIFILILSISIHAEEICTIDNYHDFIEDFEKTNMLYKKTGKGCDLSGADLQDAYLKEVDLRYADLRGANLSGADLQGANLLRADFSRANLYESNLNEANLQFALFYKTQAGRAKFKRGRSRECGLKGWIFLGHKISKGIPKECRSKRCIL